MTFAWSPKAPPATADYETWRNYISRSTGYTGSQLTVETRKAIKKARAGQSSGETVTPTEPPEPPANTGFQSVTGAEEYLSSLLKTTMGIPNLGSWALGLINRGASMQEVQQSLRYGLDTTPEGQAAHRRYLEAFPGMTDFIENGIFVGDDPEMQYLSYRNSVREAAARYGVNESMVTNDKIVGYLTNRVSAAEVAQRMSTAANAVATTPPETIAVLQDYYGVSGGDLITFFLNPDETEAMLQTRYTAARIGTEAVRQKFGLNQSEAEALAQQGMGPDQAAEGLRAASARTAFMSGAGETAARSDIVGALSGEGAAEEKIARIAASRTGRFQGGGRFTESQGGGIALGSATTR